MVDIAKDNFFLNHKSCVSKVLHSRANSNYLKKSCIPIFESRLIETQLVSPLSQD